ncbi:unnamed protein product [Sphacelaria rigidula]
MSRREDTDEAREAKCLKMTVTQPNNTSKRSDDDEWGMFVSDDAEDRVDEELSPEEKVGKLVDDEIAWFRALSVKPSDVPPREALRYWARQEKIQFILLRSVAQQAFGNQASAAQIERDFGGAGQLLSSRRSRLDGFYVEMLLFLHLNFAKIPIAKPAFTTASMPSFNPKRFTGSDPELREANDFIDPIGAAIPNDMEDNPDRLQEGENESQGANDSWCNMPAPVCYWSDASSM